MICPRSMRLRGTLRPFLKLTLSKSPIHAVPLKLCPITHFFICYMHLIKIILIGYTVYMYNAFGTYNYWHNIHRHTKVTHI